MISSEAKTALSLRGPADVVNLLNVWGLAKEKGLEGLRSIPRSIVVNEGIKRNGFRGVINVIQAASRDSNDTNKTSSEDNEPSAGTDTGRSGNKAKNQKRKKGEEDGQFISKRQAKKLKLSARSAEPDKTPAS
ncbi:RNA-binding RNA processing protein rpp1 [Metarhizium acridum]|nr:RNA-binding RNA processing protein rpp1 [Metarhizium acridum]